MALLYLAVAAGCQVTAIHVDHGLRDESAAEAEVVEAAARRFEARFEARRVRVDAGPNLEARARAARYAALPDGVLTGHTADDQAETVIINLLRGSGLDGGAGMAKFRHPILELRRSETEALCRDLELVVVRDPSNDDPAFLRNRVRRELLPQLSAMAQRDIVPLLCRSAAVIRRDVDYLDAQAAVIDVTSARELAAAPEALAARAVRRWLRHIADERHPPTALAVEQVLSVARGDVVACELGV